MDWKFQVKVKFRLEGEGPLTGIKTLLHALMSTSVTFSAHPTHPDVMTMIHHAAY